MLIQEVCYSICIPIFYHPATLLPRLLVYRIAFILHMFDLWLYSSWNLFYSLGWYGTYVAGMSPVLVCVSSLHLYTLSFNTYACIPIGIPIFTIPRLSLFLSISIWTTATRLELFMLIWTKVCLFYILYVSFTCAILWFIWHLFDV